MGIEPTPDRRHVACPSHSFSQCVNKSPFFSILYRVPRRRFFPYPSPVRTSLHPRLAFSSKLPVFNRLCKTPSSNSVVLSYLCNLRGEGAIFILKGKSMAVRFLSQVSCFQSLRKGRYPSSRAKVWQSLPVPNPLLSIH